MISSIGLFLGSLTLANVSQGLSVDVLAKEADAANVYSQPIGNRMEFFARKFLGTPYVGFTLDQNPKEERCTVLVTGLDCVTFMETVLNLARTKRPTESSLNKSVAFTRYWNGRVNGYLSRLHYTSDWIFDNDRKKTVIDFSKSLPGAERFTKQVGYMSANPEKYPALKENINLLPRLEKQEKESNQRTKWFVPLASIPEAEKQLQTGDIIALCGGPRGIDCSHVGLIIVENGVPHFVHASSTKKQVTFDERLSEFLSGSTSTIGVMVARPVENLTP
jgi:cell wall-associated NlpC family hydrolase